MQQSESHVSGVTGPHSAGTGSISAAVKIIGFSGYRTTQCWHRFTRFSDSASRVFGTGDGFTSTGTAYRGSRSGSGLQGTPGVGTPGVGTPASGSQVTGGTISGSSLDEDRPVWEQSSGKKNPRWLQDTLK